MATLTFKERVGTEQPGSAGFSLESAKAVGFYLLEADESGPVTLEDLHGAVTAILGGTGYDAADGRLQRLPPKAHPQFPWLFASNIARQWGTGKFSLEDAAPELEVPSLPQYALYKAYQFQVEFFPKPFAVALDSEIGLVESALYYPEEPGDTPVLFNYAPEWRRYTDYTLVDAGSGDSNITQTGGQVGSMVFQTAGTAKPHNTNFPGTVQLQLPNQILKVYWFGVPYRYVISPNSYFSRWRNRVNQNPWSGGGVAAQEGELLYLGFNPVKFSPPVLDEDPLWPGLYASTKLCNIEFTFLYTKRTGSDLPASTGNLNFVMNGHNLLPYFPTRKYYYATSKLRLDGTAGTPGVPSYFSFPLDILFTDPDAPGGIPA